LNYVHGVLSDDPLFFLINSYTTGISATVLENILKTTLLPLYPNGIVDAGEVGLPITRDNLVLPCGITSGEIGLPMANSKLVLPCGIYGRWEN